MSGIREAINLILTIRTAMKHSCCPYLYTTIGGWGHAHS